MTKVDGRTLDHKTLERLRMLAVRRVTSDGEAPSVVMESLGLCRTTIYRWLRRFEQKGLEGLVEKMCQGPTPTLS
jgi:transposase